jgi:hypothetical protein
MVFFLYLLEHNSILKQVGFVFISHLKTLKENLIILNSPEFLEIAW